MFVKLQKKNRFSFHHTTLHNFYIEYINIEKKKYLLVTSNNFHCKILLHWKRQDLQYKLYKWKQKKKKKSRMATDVCGLLGKQTLIINLKKERK